MFKQLIVNFEMISAAQKLALLSYTSNVPFEAKGVVTLPDSGNLCFMGQMNLGQGLVPCEMEFKCPAQGWADLAGDRGFALVRFDHFGQMHEAAGFRMSEVPAPAQEPLAPRMN